MPERIRFRVEHPAHGMFECDAFFRLEAKFKTAEHWGCSAEEAEQFKYYVRPEDVQKAKEMKY